MATKEEGSEPLQGKTWVLRVFIHCAACKKKVSKILNKVPGVISTEIDSQQNKVTVTGDVEADALIKKLAKSGKHAELWPMLKPSNPNPNPNPSGKEKSKEKSKEVEKEKDASKSNEPTEKPEKTPEISAATTSATDTKPAAETGAASKEQEPAATKPAATKPAESDVKPAESDNKEALKPDPKPDKATATGSESDTKPADATTKSDSKNKETEGAPPMHQQPAYPQPVYAASYNMMQPTTSNSYYAPMPPQHQSYMYQYNPPPPPEYYPHYHRENYYPHENYYPAESYYGHAQQPPLQSQGSYDFFSDENANACNVM